MKFGKNDADRLEAVQGQVEKWRKRMGLTPRDLLVAVRFDLANKFAWEEAIEEATALHGEYLAYYDDGRAEESPADRRIAQLEAEVARLRGSRAA